MAKSRRESLKEQMEKMAALESTRTKKTDSTAQHTHRERTSTGPSISQKNRTYDLRLKEKEIQELKSKISKLENSSLDPQMIKDLKKQVQDLQGKVPQQLSPEVIQVTEHANRDEDFFSTEEFYELIESIRIEGQAIPIVVRHSISNNFKFDLVSGRRRLEACRKLGINVIAIITEADDKRLLTLQVLENFRSDLNHFEECHNFLHMLNSGYFKSQGELARTFGMTTGKISQVMSLKVIPLWLQKEFLTVKNIVPGQQFYKIEVAPLASLRGDFVKTLSLNIDRLEGTDGLQGYLNASRSEYNRLKNWNLKIKFILNYFRSEDSKPSPTKLDFNETLKSKSKHFGTLKASRDKGIELKISRRNYSEKLTQEIIEAVKTVLAKH